MRRVTDSVRRRIPPLPRGRPSSASTAKEELQGVSAKWSWPTNSLSMKFPEAPESSSAVVWTVWVWVMISTGRVMLETELDARVLSLTERWSDDGRTGQLFLMWPAWPQYKQSWFCMRRSLSWGVRGVNPSCIGSVVYWNLGGERGGIGRAVRRERIRLSRWIVSSMNWPRVFPSSRHANSDCSSAFNPFRNNNFSVSSTTWFVPPECGKSERIRPPFSSLVRVREAVHPRPFPQLGDRTPLWSGGEMSRRLGRRSHRSPRPQLPSPKLCRWVGSKQRRYDQIPWGKVPVAG